MTEEERQITIELPEEFLELCRCDGIKPLNLLRGFVADICGFGGYQCELYKGVVPQNLSCDRDRAWAYYESVVIRNGKLSDCQQVLQ